MERPDERRHRRAGSRSGVGRAHRDDHAGRADGKAEQEGLPAARAPRDHDRRPPEAAPVLGDDAAPGDQETTRRAGRHAPAGVRARLVLPEEQRRVPHLHGRQPG